MLVQLHLCCSLQLVINLWWCTCHAPPAGHHCWQGAAGSARMLEAAQAQKPAGKSDEGHGTVEQLGELRLHLTSTVTLGIMWSQHCCLSHSSWPAAAAVCYNRCGHRQSPAPLGLAVASGASDWPALRRGLLRQPTPLLRLEKMRLWSSPGGLKAAGTTNS